MAALNKEQELWKEEACLELMNHLIVLCKLSFPRVSSLSDINSHLFVLLFEKITSLVLHDLISEPKSIEDEAHNIQIVIDTLSLDILSISLSHITGEDIISQNVLSIYNLLEVMENYLLYSLGDTEHTMTSSGMEHKMKKQKQNGESTLSTAQPKLLKLSKRTQTERSSSRTTSKLSFEYGLNARQGEMASNSSTEDPEKNCPLCTVTSKEPADRKSKGSSVLKDISNQLNGTIYQKLPHAQEEKTYAKVPFSNTPASSSSTFVPEQGTTESSITPPLISQQYPSATPLNPKFAKIGLRSDQEKSSTENILTQVPVTINERNDDLINEKNSDILRQENEEFPSKYPAKQTISNRKIARLKRRQRTSTDSSVKSHQKKNVRFCGQNRSRKHRTKEALLKNYDTQNIQYFKERLKDRTDDLQKVLEPSIFVNKVYKETFQQPKKGSTPVRKRIVSIPSHLRHNTRSKRVQKAHTGALKSSTTTQESTSEDNKFLEELQQEFPHIYLSPETKQHMQEQYHHHLQLIRNQLREDHSRKSHTQIQYEEAERRKAILLNILRKDTAHKQRMKEMHEQRQVQQRIKSTIRDNQQNKIRTRHMYEEYHQFMKRKMMRKQTKEERLLTKLYEEGLAIQKEELNELRQLAKEREQKEAKNHKIYMDSVENYYQSQFEMLAESLAIEKHDLQQRAKAQARVLEQIRRDYRQKMEKEIKSIQEQLASDGSIHFRKMDAERLRNRWKKKGTGLFVLN